MVLVDKKTEFTFSELSTEIQEKLIENEAEYIHDYGFDYISSYITDEFESELTQLGISDIEISWEGFYNQNSGAKFTGSVKGTECIKRFVTTALGFTVFDAWQKPLKFVLETATKVILEAIMALVWLHLLSMANPRLNG